DSTPIVHCPGNAACTAQGITTHQFTATGTFAVNLVVTDSAGRTGVKSTPVRVVSGNPIPSCTASPASVSLTANVPVTLNASNTQTFSGATIQSYSWNFGDPGSGPANVSTVGPSTTHTFTLPTGSKTVTISVIDSLGRQGSGTCTVTVSP